MLPSGIVVRPRDPRLEFPCSSPASISIGSAPHSTTFTATGERVGEITIPNERAVLARYFAQLPGPHQAVVEATGRWYWLRELLVPSGIDLHLAHAKFLKAIAYAKVKTDAVDAATLGQLLRAGLIPEAHMIGDALRGPRDVLRARLRMVTRRSSA